MRLIPFALVCGSCLLTACMGQSKGCDIPAPREAALDFTDLTKLLDGERQIESVLVSRDGEIVYEYHLAGDTPGTVHNFYSVAKSVTSLIAGIAVDEGFIPGEDVYISDYFPIAASDALKRKIQIKHLLSMTSGISWPEMTTWNHFFRPMTESANWIDFVLAREMSEEPGAAFNYNSANHHLVSKIIQDTTRQNMLDFGRARLFDPLQFQSVSWYNDPQGVCFGGAWIRMTAPDALKLGRLILDRGRFGDRQIVSSAWIDKMTSRQSGGFSWDEYVGGEYGYGWWINDYRGNRTVYAWGANEQYIFVTPGLNLTAVFTSTFNDRKATRPPYIYSEYIVKKLID